MVNINGKIKQISYMIMGVETKDGAGVRLKRIFGGLNTVNITDPFLLLDHFGSDRIEDYISGFPWHPHRGIETITYLLSGKVEHRDSTDHRGTIYPDELQWMTAGSGIFHEEMPKPLDEKNPEDLLRANGMPTLVSGFQLWLNLPAKYKMTVPTYRNIKGSEVPTISLDGAMVKEIAGEYAKSSGIYTSLYGIDPLYLDVSMDEESEFSYKIKEGYTTILFSVTGEGIYRDQKLEPDTAAILSTDGEYIDVRTGRSKYRFMLLSGKPLHEPLKWYGPIVMNTDEQIREAIMDLNRDTFVREKNPLVE